MSLALFVALATGCAALLLTLGLLPSAPRVAFLRLETTMSAAVIGTVKSFAISPRDAAGLPVDLVKFPAALTEIAWSCSDPAASVVRDTDGLRASVAFGTEGDFAVTVSAKNRDGAALSESIAVSVAAPTPLVASLNLAEA